MVRTTAVSRQQVKRHAAWRPWHDVVCIIFPESYAETAIFLIIPGGFWFYSVAGLLLIWAGVDPGGGYCWPAVNEANEHVQMR
jgi:hypothetical protein